MLASVFVDLPPSDINDMARLLTTIMANSRERLFEAGLLDLYHQQINTRINLHDMLDLLVISDVMSPCPARSLNTGWRGMKSTLCVTGGSHQCNKT